MRSMKVAAADVDAGRLNRKCVVASELAPRLAVGWQRYVALFGEAPHGTEQQLAAMLELLPDDDKVHEHTMTVRVVEIGSTLYRAVCACGMLVSDGMPLPWITEQYAAHVRDMSSGNGDEFDDDPERDFDWNDADESDNGNSDGR